MTSSAPQSWSFEVPGRPVPKARPRVYGGHAVTPKTTMDYEALVGLCARQAGVQAAGPARKQIGLEN